MQESTLILPSEVISPMDIARILRELENLDEFFRQAEIRQAGHTQAAPRYSRLLDSLVVANNVNLLDSKGRQIILGKISDLKNRAPVMHMSFSVDPPGPYVQKIVTWLRANIDPNVLVRVGLQPNIGAGCVVRTKNKSFDFSLRRYFDDKKEFFAQKLHEAVSEELPSVDSISEPTTVGSNSDVAETVASSEVPAPVPDIASGFGMSAVEPEQAETSEEAFQPNEYHSVSEQDQETQSDEPVKVEVNDAHSQAVEDSK